MESEDKNIYISVGQHTVKGLKAMESEDKNKRPVSIGDYDVGVKAMERERERMPVITNFLWIIIPIYFSGGQESNALMT